MNTQFLDFVSTEKSTMMKKELITILKRLSSISKFSNSVREIHSVEFRNSENDYTYGMYTPYYRRIILYVNNINSLEHSIFVFIHECSHHICNDIKPLDRSYNSEKQNEAFFKEEIRADSLAIALIKKYFSESYNLLEIVKEVKLRIQTMHKLMKDIIRGWKNRDYDYKWTTSTTWKWNITWNPGESSSNGWKAITPTSSSNSNTRTCKWSSIALAC